MLLINGIIEGNPTPSSACSSQTLWNFSCRRIPFFLLKDTPHECLEQRLECLHLPPLCLAQLNSTNLFHCCAPLFPVPVSLLFFWRPQPYFTLGLESRLWLYFLFSDSFWDSSHLHNPFLLLKTNQRHPSAAQKISELELIGHQLCKIPTNTKLCTKLRSVALRDCSKLNQ